MTKYAVYCPECDELWENTFETIEAAADAIKCWCIDIEELSELERYQIVEVKPIAKIEAKIKYKLKAID